MKIISFAMSALLISAGSVAKANTISYTDAANHYSVTVDTDVWGIDVLLAGAKLSIFNLYDVAVSGSSRGVRTAGYGDAMLNGVTFTALSGYSLSSITVGWTGSYSSPGNTSAVTERQISWITNGSAALALTEQKNIYCEFCSTADPSFTVVNSAAGNFDVQFTQVFDANTGTASFSNWIEGSVYAWGAGSSAQLTQASTYFTVVATPVPEAESLALYGAGLLFIGGVVRRRKQG